MKGYKMIKADGTDFRTGQIKYEIGKKVYADKANKQKRNRLSLGISVAKEAHIPLGYNARYPWRLLEVQFNKKDIIEETGDKYIVEPITPIKELNPWELGFPNSKRVYDKIASASKIRLMAQTDARKKKIQKLVEQHISRLNHAYGKSEVKLEGITFHTINEWDSVRDSVRDSVWASVWASVEYKDDSNPFLPLQRICETGAVFYGVDKNGIAHVIMPDSSEVD